jgi:hypothetical protein
MILFLDFDGVLHGLGRPALECLPRFEAILRDFPKTDVVISSSWRETYPWEVLLKFFSEDIRSKIVGATPVIASKWPPYPAHARHDEIIQFLLQQQIQDRRWLILDDDARLFPKDCRELVLLDPATGLDDVTEAVLRRRICKETLKNSREADDSRNRL